MHRCKFGFGDLDESFYLTIPYRVFQGDALFKDEWNLSLMSSFMQYPFMKFFMLINNSTDGIILAFRYMYVCFSAISSFIIYNRLKKINEFGAEICSLVLFIYIPFGICAFSYNSMGIVFFTFGCVYSLTANNKCDYIFIGIANALSVLCFPLLLFLYIFYYFYLLFFIKKRKNVMYILSGALFIATIFFIFIFSKITITSFVHSLPYLLSDGDHSINFFDKLYVYLECFSGYNEYQLKCMLPYLLILVLIMIDKNRCKHKDAYLLISMINVILMLIVTFKTNYYINFMMYPISILAPICILYDNNNEIFKTFWIFGVVFTFVVHLCSNQNNYAITGMSVVATLATIMMLSNIVLREHNNKNTKIIALFFIICMLLLSTELYLRWNNVYWDNGINNQTEYIGIGPEKGIYTSKIKKDTYLSYIEDINNLDFNGNDVLFLTYDKQWLYLIDGGKFINSSYSSCFPLNSIDIMLKYYELNPEKIPHNIYADYGKFNDNLASVLAKEFNMSCVTTSIGNYFYTR